MKKIGILTLFLLGNLALVANDRFIQFAPDVRWDAEIHAYVGFANPLPGDVTVTLWGYARSGEFVNSAIYELGAFQRVERGLNDLFASTQVAWIRLESTHEVGAFVRFEHQDGQRVSTYPFTPYAGSEFWVPHIARDTSLFFTEVGVANVSSEPGSALSQPFMDNIEDEEPPRIQASDPLAVPQLGEPGQQTVFEYENLYGEMTPYLQWDNVKTEGDFALAAVQHFGKKGSELHQLASVVLPRTPSYDLIISHVNRDRENFWTGLVLINTKPAILPVRIQSYLEDGSVFQTIFVEMQPFEKQTFLINNTNELGLSDIAAWFRVTSFERTLLGYEIFGSPDNRVMAGMEPAPEPASMLVLPYTPTSDQLWTGVGVINPFEETINVQIGGFDDAGNMIGVFDCERLVPNEKRLYTYDQMFGENASRVTWSRVDTNRGVVSAFSLTGDRDRNFLSAIQATPNLSLAGSVFIANFEFDELAFMKDQGWTELRFDPEFHIPDSKGFFMQRWYEAKSGIFHLGFESETLTFGLGITHESKAMMSQFIDIPNDEFDYYISFYLRLVDPELARHDGRYGIVWKEEGSSTFNWYGLSGEYLLSEDQPFDFRDRIAARHYRDETHFMTEWMPFEVMIPRSVKGKRIQVGPYFSQSTPADTYLTREAAPIMFVDLVRVSPTRLPIAFELYPEGKGSFIPSSIVVEE